MPTDYERMYSVANLARAYRWVQSNSEAYYKSFFRDAYAAYAGNSSGNLRRLRRTLARNAYEPSHGSKLFLPKPSGLLRPYTLLTVDDQIVYQAAVNVIADKLRPKIKKRYGKVIFGHMYAGKSSQFFYMKWQNGYRAYSKAVVAMIDDGYKHVANFDLTAFYDSIDHHVLQTFLHRLGIDDELTDFLMRCLKQWTSADWPHGVAPIYQGHGIPQGPLSSGLLSEVVLSYLDEKGAVKPAKYLRYVDDIKLFAKSAVPLRQQLISLDLATKDIGLFPQGSKINIREVTDPASEVKSVSNPPEPALGPVVRQDKLQARLLEIGRTVKLLAENKTKFKYLLGRAEPSHRLNKPLMRIMKAQPALAASIVGYFKRYARLPRRLADDICSFLEQDEVYHSVHADLLMAVLENMHDDFRARCAAYCRKRIGKTEVKKRGEPQVSFKAALWAWLLRENRVTYVQIEQFLKSERDAWVVKDVVARLSSDHLGTPSHEALLNLAITLEKNADANRVAAVRIVDESLSVTAALSDIANAGKPDLFLGGKIKRIGKAESLVGIVLSRVLGYSFPVYDWGRLLGAQHVQAERLAFNVQRHYESSIDACIVALDSLCDLVFERLFGIHLPGKGFGNYGAMLANPTLLAALPTVCTEFKTLHDLRCESATAHPRNTKKKIATRRLKHHDLRKTSPGLIRAIKEILLLHP